MEGLHRCFPDFCLATMTMTNVVLFHGLPWLLKPSFYIIDIVRDLLSFEFKFIVIHYFVFPKCIYKTTFSEKSFSTMHSYLQCVLANGSGQIKIFLAQ